MSPRDHIPAVDADGNSQFVVLLAVRVGQYFQQGGGAISLHLVKIDNAGLSRRFGVFLVRPDC